MSNYKSEHLFLLIKTLSKSEKRNFRLYANRIKKNKYAKFMKLFEIINKINYYNEQKILKNVPIKKKQLSNIKAHLYKQILISLKQLQHTVENHDIQIREYLDFAKILYNKGLYIQSLKLLGKAKIIAKYYESNTILLELVEFEKMIESQHITRSIYSRSGELSTESKELIEKIQCNNALSSLSLELYGLYLKVGYVRNKKDKIFIETYFRTNFPKFDINKLSFYEKLFLYQAQVWYHYIRQDFIMCYRSSYKWIELFQNYTKSKKIAPVSYLKGYHYLLDTLFYLNHYSKFIHVFKKFEEEVKNGEILINGNTKILIFMYTYTNRINKHYMEGSFSEGVKKVIPSLFVKFNQIYNRLDSHYIMILYYKIACLYFGSGDNENTILYLSKIMESKKKNIRQDLQCFARLLYLIACYESGLDENMDQKIKSTYKFFIQMDDWYIVQKKIIHFFQNLGNVYPHQIKNQFKKLKDKLIKYYNHPYEKRTFLYLDIISWIDSKIENKSVELIIKEKFLKNNQK
ncbi:hypothetical protein G9C01_00635 [Blattabacterium sp. DPU]|uniref:hypothetical protein n=1 Tax=Blattabacterium sp. DPU TaxID=2715232 RepID=UPI00140AA55E|nr:hypothetical protein [Blattabacterium sp. DPU]QIK16900.1 hypothetical protein G9C01_00635 [Blattabacterium sp. DPU]